MKMPILLAFAVTGALAAPSAKFDAEVLLKDSDRARGGVVSGVAWKITLKTVEKGVASERVFSIRVKGENSLAEALEPASYKGEVYLFQGRNMWFFKPGLRRAVTISSRQRLSGQAANGDIASTNYAKDYTIMSAKEEVLEGKPAYLLLLKGKDKKVTYDQIRYWISKAGHLAVKAEFLSLDGTPLKRARLSYENKIKVGAELVPFVSKMEIEDAQNPKETSVLTYDKPAEVTVSDNEFNVNRIMR